MNNLKYIFIKGEIETLNYFSMKLYESFKLQGKHVYFHDIKKGFKNLIPEISLGNTVLITFNCIAVSGEPAYMNNGISYWSIYRIPVINILVDHPLYYHSPLSNISTYSSEYTHVICIDRFHLKYLNKYYPEVKNSSFMVLGGSGSEYYKIPASKRKNEIIFTGNFTPCERFLKFACTNGEEYRKFYMDIIDDLLSDTKCPLEKVCIEHIKKELPNSSLNDIRQVMSKMIFIDLYVRFYLRGSVISSIYKAGLPIKIIGKGFETLNIKCTELLPTDICLEETANSHLSINVMPWFRDGSHDRILSSMLCGSLVLSDPSIWLSENFTNNVDYVEYDNTNMPELVNRISSLLDDPELIDYISENGRKKALNNHTWSSRALEIAAIANSLLV